MDTDQTKTHQSSSKSFDASNAPEPDPTPPAVSKEEREGVPPDDMEARTPLGVGESIQRGGENIDTEESGGSDRDAQRRGGTTDEF